jgi:hypothetical protein
MNRLNNRFRTGLVCLIVIITAVVGSPRSLPAVITYYVDPASGDDGFTGGAGDPWRTIHYAITQLAADDVLILKDGSYSVATESDSTLLITSSNITIQAENPGGAILDGAGAVNWDRGLYIVANGVTIKDLVIKRFAMGGMTIFSGSGHTITGNEIFDNGDSMNGAEGILLLSGLSNTSVTYNEIYWSGDINYRQWYGIQCSSLGSAVEFKNNNVFDHDDVIGIGVVLSISPVNVSLNRIWDNRIGIDVEDSSDTASMIWNNVIYRDAGTMETGVLVNMTAAGSTTPQVFHNTIDGGSLYGIRTTNTGANPKLYYNMITNFTAGAGVSVLSGASPDLRYNNLYGNGTSHSGIAPGVGDASLAPGYVGGTDYHLTASSAAIGLVPAGESDPVSADIEGVPRPAGEPRDPGAYEYPSSSPETVTMQFLPGDTSVDYEIRSMPLSLPDKTPVGAFGSQIGAYDPTLMRIGRWVTSLQGYVEYPGLGGDIHPGDACWFLFRNGATLKFTGSPTATSPDPKDGQQAAPIDLHPGWNQVGNPFTYPVAISNMVVSNNDGTPAAEDLATGTLTQGIFWVYDNGEYYAASKLPVSGGGWILKTGEPGRLWVKNIAVSYSSLDLNGAAEILEYSAVPADAERPPAPPGSFGDASGGGDGGNGGGGGGCFIDSAAPGDVSGPFWLLQLFAGLLTIPTILLARRIVASDQRRSAEAQGRSDATFEARRTLG